MINRQFKSGQQHNHSVLDHFTRKPYDGTKRDWLDFDAELRTAIKVSCGQKGMEYMFTEWPEEGIDEPEFIHKPLLDDLDEVDRITQRDARGRNVQVDVTNEMRRERRSQNKSRREHNVALEQLLQKLYEAFSSRISRTLNEELSAHGGNLIDYYNFMLQNYGPASLGPQANGRAKNVRSVKRKKTVGSQAGKTLLLIKRHAHGPPKIPTPRGSVTIAIILIILPNIVLSLNIVVFARRPSVDTPTTTAPRDLKP